MRNDFTQYLIGRFQDWYQGWDDGGPDAEARWLENLSYDDLMDYAECFAQEYADKQLDFYIKTHSIKFKLKTILYRLVALFSYLR